MLDRQVMAPPGYAERSCLLVRYRLPGLRHCFVLCHEPQAGQAVSAPELLTFFLGEAERLAHAAVGDAQAFMLIYSGSAIRKRPNWHLHVFVVQRRWQKAWVYTVLGMKNSRWLSTAYWHAEHHVKPGTMPHHTLRRPASLDEAALLQERLADAPTTASRWREGTENALVLWAASLLGFAIVWLITAGLAHRLVGIDYGVHSDAAPWLLGIATLLCAAYAVGSSILWVKCWKDYRPSLTADIAAAQVIEEHYVFDSVQRFQEPEHNGLIYFLHTTEGRVLTLYDHESQDLGVQSHDPLASNFKPMSRLTMVRAPQTGWVISKTFSGKPLELPDPVELNAPPEQWPETEAYCTIPWCELERVLGTQEKR